LIVSIGSASSRFVSFAMAAAAVIRSLSYVSSAAGVGTIRSILSEIVDSIYNRPSPSCHIYLIQTLCYPEHHRHPTDQ
jgi:hypothetical protein